MDKGINIILPADGSTKEVNEDDIINIALAADGSVVFDEKQKQMHEIKSLVERKIAKNENIIFSVKTSPRANYQDYIFLLDELKKARATKISIANAPRKK
jgi:biopolymer transport protein ExbD